jgi:peptide chain release factor 2
MDDKDIRIDTWRDAACNIAHQGVSVRITHIPTGLVVTSASETGFMRNKRKALDELQDRLAKLASDSAYSG